MIERKFSKEVDESKVFDKYLPIEGKPINTTTNYPIDVCGATFYYKIAPDGMVIVYHNNWEGITGAGKTIQEAINNMVKYIKENTNKYEGIDDKLYAWCKKIRNLL